jgi:toxin FitB
MYVLDTNLVSELRKVRSGQADAGVAAWASGVAVAEAFVSAITLHELEHSVLLVERRDPAAGAVLRRWLDTSVTEAFADRVLAVDADVAQRAAALHVPDPAPSRDAFIGATALVHRMAVVTRNAPHFTRFAGLDVVNPWR